MRLFFSVFQQAELKKSFRYYEGNHQKNGLAGFRSKSAAQNREVIDQKKAR
jgi:hypothetical protein